jgi:uncharacterized membrane protein YiaA
VQQVTESISQAIRWTGRVLFQPFDFTKWLVLGFCAFLALLGEGGGGGNFNWNTPPGSAAQDAYYRAEDWALAHLSLLLMLVIGLIVALLLLWLAILWVSSRGKFMFVDGVVHDRAAVVEPWKRFRSPGNSVFLFRIAFALVTFVAVGISVGLLVTGLWALGFNDHDLGVGGIGFVVGWIGLFLALIFGVLLVVLALNDFVVPIMWVRECGVTDAWAEFLSVLSANVGPFLLYLLFKILFAIAIGGIACTVTCLTCCLAAVPYVGTVMLLPLHVFRRSFSLYFLSRLHPDYGSLAPAE